MRFDKYMNFKNQIEHNKKCCSDRLNIIKRLSHETWNIDIKTLSQIYKTLIRTINDYSFFIFSKISSRNIAKLQAIQNNALRIIYEKDRLFSVALLHQMAELDTLKQRAEAMKNNYFSDAINNSNPIINDLIKEFDNYIITNKNANNITI